MRVIDTQTAGKTFRTHRRLPGWRGVVRNFFHREYTEVHALADVSLAIDRGELVGLIGENGAGKTTLVKLLTGIIPVSSGSCRLLGQDSFHLDDDAKRRISLVMGQRSQLWWDVPPLDSFHLLREIYRIPEDRFQRNLNGFAERLQVRDQLDLQLRKLSLGQRMKMEIIGALLHDPEVVFLDEPTIGLDLVSRETIREFLIEVNRERQVTILLTSHDMEDIERTCRRILILEAGRLVHDGDLVELMHRIRMRRAVDVHIEPGSRDWSPADESAVSRLGATLERSVPGQLSFVVDADRVQELTRYLLDQFAVRDLAVERQPLAHLIRALYANGNGNRQPELAPAVGGER